MTDTIGQRACAMAVYMIENGTTVRATAAHFGISKSTVHKDVTERLAILTRPLAEAVRNVLEKNKAERHIRGGQATKEKYNTLHQIRVNG